MDGWGHCPVCGRTRTTSPSGAPVSCCPRWVDAPRELPPPERAGTVGEVFRVLRDEAARVLSAGVDALVAGSGLARLLFIGSVVLAVVVVFALLVG